jgi:hypothetical protein
MRHIHGVAILAIAAWGGGVGAVGAQPPGGMMGGRHDSTTMKSMQAIHELLMRHDRIDRTVTELPDGVRTLTESDDPALALRIREHVAQMYRLLAAGRDPGLPHTTDVLRGLFRNRERIRTTMDTTPKGIVVVQTSSDSAVAALLRQHAAEVTEMVRGGMEALHHRMMHGSAGAMPMGVPDSAFRAMQERGRSVMGVDQYTSTHRFDILPDGGRIELQRNEPDSAGVAQIRAHLLAIAAAFASGDFGAPAMVHLQRVPGADVMTDLRHAIRYSYSELPLGGQVRIETRDAVALKAIHTFLEFQRREHKAGGAGGRHKHPG